MESKEKGSWFCKWEVRKYHEDITPFKGREGEFHKLFQPYEILKGKENCFLLVGIGRLWSRFVQDGVPYPYSETYAMIGVGDSSTPANSSQGGLQASTNKAYKHMDSGYPNIDGVLTTGVVIWRASFGSSEANFAWHEWVVTEQHVYPGNEALNRRVVSLGTKTSGETWRITVTTGIS
jgi:hypothetical protein